MIPMLKRFLLLCVLLIVPSYATSQEEVQVEKTSDTIVKIVNSSGHNVYGHYEIGNSKGTVGVLAAGKSALLESVSFAPEQQVKVNFRCDKADLFDCAVGKVDVTKIYPIGNYRNVTTVFTFVKMRKIVLSFIVSESNSNSGLHKEIVIGSISN